MFSKCSKKFRYYFSLFTIFIFTQLFLIAEIQGFELVWVVPSSSGYFEKDWIKELLKGHAFTERDSLDLDSLHEETIIVVVESNPLSWKQIRALEKCKNRGIRVGAFHLSDETLKANCSWYSKVDFVFRQYFHPEKNTISNVECIPLGCKQGFQTDLQEQDLKTFAERSFLWSFMGQVVKSNRLAMFKSFRKIKGPSYHHFNKDFNSSDCLSISDYQAVFFETQFAPCPFGFHNPDTFRLYEALESGCIPIVEDPEDNYFRNFYEDPPFIILHKWQELSRIIKPYLEDENLAEIKRLECFRWWKEEKRKVQKNITEKINKFFQGSSK